MIYMGGTTAAEGEDSLLLVVAVGETKLGREGILVVGELRP